MGYIKLADILNLFKGRKDMASLKQVQGGNVFTKDNVFNVILLVLYAVLTLLTVLHHEVWRDEAQVWQLCTHLSLPELFKHLVNEGHPSFFYLLNMPFAKMGCSIFAMQIICWLASCGAVYLLLNHSPFNKLTKFILVTSGMFLYFFPVIARSYSIIPVLVFALAMLYPKQKEHPYWYSVLIFLVANTHVIMLGFAGMLTLLFIWGNLWKNRKTFSFQTNKSYVFSSLVAVFGLFAVWLQLHGTTSSNIFISYDFQNIMYNLIQVTTKFFVAGFDSSYIEVFSELVLNGFQFSLVIVSSILFLFLFVLIFKNDKKIFLISFLGVLFQFIVYVLAYNKCALSQRTFCAYIIVLFGLWCVLNKENITDKTKKIINITLIIFFLLTTLNGIRYTILDLRYPYSGGKETAQFIEKSSDNSLFFSDKMNVMYDISLLPYLKTKKLYTIPDYKSIVYIYWDQYLQFYSNNYSMFFDAVKENEKNLNTDNLYVICTQAQKDMDLINTKNLELVYVSKPSVIKSEKYYIYKYLGNN